MNKYTFYSIIENGKFSVAFKVSFGILVAQRYAYYFKMVIELYNRYAY